MTALHWACKKQHFKIIKFLIEQDSDIEIKDYFGRTPL